MIDILIYLIIGVFGALLFLNIYFRLKVLRIYKILVKNRIEFNASHIFNSKKMESEVLNKYPTFRTEITGFVHHIKLSIGIAIVLVLVITILGAYLHYTK